MKVFGRMRRRKRCAGPIRTSRSIGRSEPGGSDAEWRLREDMMQAGQAALAQFGRTRGRASVPSIVRLIDLASRLGRRAAGLPENGAAPASAADAPPMPDFEAALRKVYGEPRTAPDPSECNDEKSGAIPRDAFGGR